MCHQLVRRIGFLALLLTAVHGSLCLSHATPAKSPAVPKAAALLERGEPVTVVCFGDSITGVYYHTGGRRAYPKMLQIALQRLYPRARVTVRNAGVSGHTTRHALARIERDVLAHRPQLVTVMFGMNDLTAIPPDTFTGNLAEIIRRCRGVDAEVLLCTPNDVLEPGGRPRAKVAEYAALIRKVAGEQKVAVADCFEAFAAIRTKDALRFAFLMSDEIHPNMDGHKLLAETIARAVGGREVSLTDVGPPQPAIPRTLALLKAGKPVRVLAMPPYDGLIAAALRQAEPSAKVEVTPWPTAGQTLAQIERAARKVRGMKPDLVIVAVPAAADAEPVERYVRSYSWVLNWSLSFGVQEWDCVALPPSTATPELPAAGQERDPLARRLIAAQDLGTVLRGAGNRTPVADLLAGWLREQLRGSARK
jgi:lysophospholipase L1-like esterase